MSKLSKLNILKKVQEHLKSLDVDYLYLSSFDHFLSEYVPLDDSFRLFMTNFTGSVAEGLIPKIGKMKIYVDGRYHEQADQECDHEIIEIVKVPFGEGLFDALSRDLSGDITMGVLAKRTPQSFRDRLTHLKWKEVSEEKLFEEIGFEPKVFKGPLWEVPLKYTGRTVGQRCAEFLKEGEYAFINALDTLAWFSNLRASHLPFQGTFRSLGFATSQKLYLFVEDELMEFVKPFASADREVHELAKMNEVLSQLPKPNKVIWDAGACNIHNYDILCDVFGSEVLHRDELGFHTRWQAIKNESEILAFKESFENSDKAIYESLVWLIERTRSGVEVSEVEFRDKSNAIYRSHGARTQSFKTIAGFGANGSIIHYSNPSDQKKYKSGENVLMDSGAIYEQGMATDCTRTIVPAGKPAAEQVKNYTLVLKGFIQLMKAKFEVGTLGKDLDNMSRAPLQEHGLNYAHGTGHGVGVNVHESGYSIRPESRIPMQENLVGSIEPGCYEPGKAGIRLENIAHVKKVDDKLGFDSFVYIGLWPDLIDRTLLSSEEIEYLDEYEAECEKRGRSFKQYSLH